MKWLDRIPLGTIAVMALLMGLAPFWPQPHLLEKLGMLMAGQLVRPIDIFDLFWHGLFPLLLAVKLMRVARLRQMNRGQ
jgi:hypothetical protein